MPNTEGGGKTINKPRKLTERALKGVAWSGGASVLRLGVKFVSVAILARLLSPRDYGVVGGALVIVDLAAMLYGLGLTPTLVQRKDIERDHIATAFGLSLAVACVAGAALWFAAPLIAALMRIEQLTGVIRWLALTTPIGAFNLICEALLARNMRVREIALRPLFSFSIATFAVAIPLALTGFGYWSLVAMQIAEVTAGALAFGFAARRLLAWPGFSASAFHDLWPMSLGFSLMRPFDYLAGNTDKFLIARLMGAEALGLYSRASFLTQNVGNLFDTIARIVAFPALVQVQADKERLRSALLKALFLTALVTIPASMFSIVFAEEIIDILLGRHWGKAVIPFALLSASLYFRLGRRTSYAMLQAIGRPYQIIIINCIVTATLIAGFLATYSYGLDGACTIVTIALGAAFVIMVWNLCRAIELRIGEIARIHIVPLSLGALVLVIGMGVKSMLHGQSSIIILSGGTLLVAASVLTLLRFMPETMLGQWGAEAARKALKSVPFGSRVLAPAQGDTTK